MRTAGVILAGGASSRMGGGHKFLLDLGGKPLIGHVVERFAPQVGFLAISANCDPAMLPRNELPVLADLAPSRGPLSGLLAGLEWASGLAGVTHLATAAADTPFLPADIVGRLVARMGGGQVALARSEGRLHPTFGLWDLSVRPALADYLARSETSRVVDFARQLRFLAEDFEDGFFNINEPADMREAIRRLAASNDRKARFPPSARH